MSVWPQQPIIYEINTWTWLGEMQAGTLAQVPDAEWDRIAALGADAVWLMGVWQRSPAGRQVSLTDPGLQAEYGRQLHDFCAEDVSGSPYSIRAYSVDAHLGGAEGLKAARAQLAKRGMRLLLDFVPNHVAPDHAWTSEHPEYLIRGTQAEAEADPAAYFLAQGNAIARGKDPYFAPWPDTAQLNAFDAGLRAAAQATLAEIAQQCDGVRCDMAMLFLNQVFSRTWGERAGAPPREEYWPELIAATRRRSPGFLFIAEAYWDLEARLMDLGFDYCYDKRLYDRLEHGSAEGIYEHLKAGHSYQQHLIRFLENHDEPRCAAAFPAQRAHAAAVVWMTIPGAKLVHEGQMEGYRGRHCVHLGRRAAEVADPILLTFYQRLFAAVRRADLRDGQWLLCHPRGWPDNQTCRNLLAWTWQVDDRFYLVVVNFSDAQSQARLPLAGLDTGGGEWKLADQLSDRVYAPRNGAEMMREGLYLDMAPWDCHFFALERL